MIDKSETMIWSLKSYISIVYDKVPILECLSAGYAGFGTWLRAAQILDSPAQIIHNSFGSANDHKLLTYSLSNHMKYLD